MRLSCTSYTSIWKYLPHVRLPANYQAKVNILINWSPEFKCSRFEKLSSADMTWTNLSRLQVDRSLRDPRTKVPSFMVRWSSFISGPNIRKTMTRKVLSSFSSKVKTLLGTIRSCRLESSRTCPQLEGGSVSQRPKNNREILKKYYVDRPVNK